MDRQLLLAGREILLAIKRKKLTNVALPKLCAILIYGFLVLSRFRQGFKSVFRCCKWKEETINPLEQRKFTAARQNTVNGIMALQTVTESLSGSNPLIYNKYVRHDRVSNL
ncbi:tachykinin-like peptides receptor 99D [Caerostris darwini]|uniref:Tachykinin-like peptides receptor 99D n=1 Tax=Caerostris darwini TaxID=1538125 RepID=A0AAV4VK55_9ARAC|nr:tachykinin-like peptides receptor 99D [Caerostris darwini]